VTEPHKTKSDPETIGPQAHPEAGSAAVLAELRKVDSASPPRDEPEPLSPFRQMNMLFAGLAVSVAYGLLGSVVLYFVGSRSEAQAFFVAYTSSFKTVVSLGLITGTALIIYRSQDLIPQTIETAFSSDQLADTKYAMYKWWFYSKKHSVIFSAEFVVVAFVIFTYCQFPLTTRGEVLMVVAACIQYALGVYVGRKLCYAGMMLHSLLSMMSELDKSDRQSTLDAAGARKWLKPGCHECVDEDAAQR
jgi:hypothetical protein